MIMQPSAYKPTQSFPRRTFKGLAGLTIALGISIIVIGVGEIIYSVEISKKCDNSLGWHDDYPVYMDDEVFPEERNEHFREKRSHRRDHKRPGEWMGDVRDSARSSHSDWDSSDEAEHNPHLRWLSEAVEGMHLEQRCEIFSGAAIIFALGYICCGVIFIVTGSLGVGAARTIVGHRQSGLKTGFIVMNILNVLGFAPTVAILGGIVSKAAPIVVQKDDYYMGHVITGKIVAFIGIILTVLSLLGASISCCCAPTEEHVKVITMSVPPIQEVIPVVPAQLQVDEKAQLVENEVSQA